MRNAHLKPMKPTALGQNNNLPGKVFTTGSAGYNSQKNLRNANQTMNVPSGGANNRYNSDFEDEEEIIDDGDGGLEVAEENHVAERKNEGGYLNTEQCFSDSAPETLS